MNLFADIRDVILNCLDQLVAEGVLPGGLNTDPITAEPPRDPAHGDMATNAAMVLAKPAAMKPRDAAGAQEVPISRACSCRAKRSVMPAI